MKKLIVVDGVDSSGKETNTNYIYEMIKNEISENVKKITFPDYNSDSSALVKMYLAGEFGTNPSDVSPYASSTFYAVDRYASFKKDWGVDFDKDGYIVADRYVTSNMVHQCAKIDDEKEKDKFLSWLDDLEYEKLGLPRPDVVIYLNMPIWAAQKLMAERKNKITGESKKDIHESDISFLQKSYDNAMSVAKKQGWNIVNCTDGDRIKSLEEIQKEIKEIVLKYI